VADDPNAASGPTAEPNRPGVADAADDWTAEEVLAADGAGAARSPEGEAGTVIPDPSSWLPGLAGRSTTPGVCPFLRAAGPDDVIGVPIESPDVTNRCAALREPVPQSLRQQELVCLTSGHINCPRYLRGALVASEAPAGRRRLGMGLTPAIAAALAVLVLSFGVSVAFVVANGGLTLPVAAVAATASPSGTAAAAGPLATPGAQPTPRTLASAGTSVPSVTPSAKPSGLPTATPIVTPSPSPATTPKPKPTSSRYALLKPCPDKPKCWIYVIRSGDNLVSIAHYFGVSVDRVRALNPWTRTQGLRAGRELILPPPTR
jgi:LysM domain